MKERVYALYPSATDVCKSHREAEFDTYTKECFYRYGRSRYHDPRRSVREETTGKGLQEDDDLPTKGLNEVVLKASKISFQPRPPPGPSSLPVRSKSAVEAKPVWALKEPEPSRVQRGGSSLQGTRGRASSAWLKSRDWLAETSTSCRMAFKDLAPDSPSPGSVQIHQAPQAVPIPVPSAYKLSTNGHATRAQSAVIRRHGSQVVKRSIQSAGPERQTPTLVDPAAAVSGPPEKEEQVRRRPRPSAPTPLRWRRDEEDEGEGEAAEGLQGKELPLDYDEQLKIHGWKMELPGDPLRMKRGCLAKRLSTTVVIPVADVSRKATPTHVQSSETFFYNTLPRMPMSFTIHPDWSSELLQTKRMELKAKKTGADAAYLPSWRTADFSFVY